MPQLVVMVAEFEFRSQGWSEKYYAKGDITDPLAAVPILKNIIWGRSAFFGTEVGCTYGRCSKIGPGPDKETVFMDYPIGPHPSWTGGGGAGDTIGPINDPIAVVQQVFQGVGGKWMNRYYRCYPDSWVTNKRLATGILPYWTPSTDTSTVTDLSPAAGLSHIQVCQKFWRFLIQNTVMTRRVTAIDYTPTAIRDIGFVQITGKKIGRPFRQSRGRRPATLVS